MAFSFLYFVLAANSLVLDGLCYGRILNYMRKNAVRVMVVAVTAEERAKVCPNLDKCEIKYFSNFISVISVFNSIDDSTYQIRH